MNAVAIAAYASILAAAAWWVDSRLLWLIYGPLFVAFVDAVGVRAIVKPTRSRRSVLIGAMLLAAVTIFAGLMVRKFLKIPVPYSEIARMAVTGGLLWFLFESLCVLFVRWSGAGSEGTLANTAKRVGATLAAMGPLAFFLLPLVNLHPPHVFPTDLRKHFPADYEEVEFAAEGVRLSGWWAESPSPRGNVLLCHGHGQCRSQMAAVLSHLQKAGYNVLAFDFRGHGSSGGMTITFGAREVADMTAAAAFVQEKRSGLPLYIVGFSYGAIVSLQALPELPTVAAVWVDSPCGRFSEIAEKYFSFLPAPIGEAVVAGYDWASWIDCGFRISEINPAAALKNVRIPIHFSHCQGDPLIPFDGCKRMHDDYEGPKSSDFPAVDRHGAFSNVVAEEYMQKMTAFLAQH